MPELLQALRRRNRTLRNISQMSKALKEKTTAATTAKDAALHELQDARSVLKVI